MKNLSLLVATMGFAILSVLSTSTADEIKVAPAQWDLTPLFADEAAWRNAFSDLEKNLTKLRTCKGNLGSSSENMEKCLSLLFQMKLRMARLASWSSLQRASDVRSSTNNERMQLTEDLSAHLRSESSFLVPEVAKIKTSKIESFLTKNHKLNPYRQLLREIKDQSAHILDPAREELLATLSPVLRPGSGIQSLLLSADIAWPTLTLKSGAEKIDTAAYTRLRESNDRDQREKVFTSFFASLTQYQRTLGANLANSVKTTVIRAKLRGYKSALQAALDGEQIPEEVYRTLITQVNTSLPSFHRYLRHHGDSLGLKKLEYFDAYVSGDDLDLKFSLENSKQLVLGAVEPLGNDYVQRLKHAFSQQWMDVHPREGKVNGAFMDGSAFEVHPYILLNHQDNFSSLSTLAHEWGHAMHSLYSNEAQPYVTSGYSTFIAEIASTLNEILLNEKMIADAKTAKEKRFYLETLLKMIRGTFYRQTQFAEFELSLHEELEKGDALSGQKISKIFGEIARKYYGHAAGVMNIDEKYFSEWAFVPHFYRGFYVYQYATCLAAAFYFAEGILTNKPRALENYLNVLKAGGSKYPYEILKEAGVDMKAPRVYQAVAHRLERALDELSALK